MKLSKRMEAIAAMVTHGGRLADIGTDHAYVPIVLVERGVVQSAIAMDIRPGPLARAQENIAAAGLADRMDTRLSDGLSELAPGEADTIVIAGMGGMLIKQILSNGREAAHSARELILQPQSDLTEFRSFLQREGYRILDEDMLCEDGKYYTVIKAVWKQDTEQTLAAADSMQEQAEEPDDKWTRMQEAYGPVLLAQKHPVLKEFLQKEQRQLQKLLEELSGAGIHKSDVECPESDTDREGLHTEAQERIVRRRNTLAQRLECCRQALQALEG